MLFPNLYRKICLAPLQENKLACELYLQNSEGKLNLKGLFIEYMYQFPWFSLVINATKLSAKERHIYQDKYLLINENCDQRQ